MVDRDKLIEQLIEVASWAETLEGGRVGYAVAAAVIDALGIEQVAWYSGETVRQWKPGSTAHGYLAFIEEYDADWPGLVPVFRIRGIESGEDR